MTNEEFDEILERTNAVVLNREWCEMALKALEQEPIIDKIRAEIETQEKWLAQAGYNAYNVDIAFNSIKLVLAEMRGDGNERKSN